MIEIGQKVYFQYSPEEFILSRLRVASGKVVAIKTEVWEKKEKSWFFGKEKTISNVVEKLVIETDEGFPHKLVSRDYSDIWVAEVQK